MKYLSFILSLIFASLTALAENPLDYETLTHTLSVETLRAGSHDPNGTNDYYFAVAMYSLLNSADERNLEFDKRKKIKVDLGTFGETTLEALKSWKPEGQSNDKKFKIAGDAIRKIAAQSMQEFKVSEADLAVLVEIQMFEKAKKYYFFGDDTLITKTQYFPISQTKFEKAADADLTMQDDKGLHVNIKVHFQPANERDKK